MPSTSRNPSPTRNQNASGIQRKTYDQAKYWLLTIPVDDWSVPESLPPTIAWLRGQQEIGEETGYHHWQLFVAFKQRQRRSGVKSHFTRTTSARPSNSDAAEAYVHKEDTAVAGTRFELGAKVIFFVCLLLIVGFQSRFQDRLGEGKKSRQRGSFGRYPRRYLHQTLQHPENDRKRPYG